MKAREGLGLDGNCRGFQKEAKWRMMREIGNTCQNIDVTLRWLLPTLGEANLACSWGMAKNLLASPRLFPNSVHINPSHLRTSVVGRLPFIRRSY
jgi:hypothetical protein